MHIGEQKGRSKPQKIWPSSSFGRHGGAIIWFFSAMEGEVVVCNDNFTVVKIEGTGTNTNIWGFFPGILL